MKAEYFKKKICEELDGACEYAKEAAMTKASYPKWSDKFVQMSDMELSHASNLIGMLNELAETNTAYEDAAATMSAKYAEEYAKVKLMHKSLESIE